ncbi:MAG: putative deoxyribonuclease YjjV [Promethearchaeota archaeon]|nr:MAG: putative deoxyribonuclease YjjV [Candidatus Lokiarchaeota archaeon]
MLIDIHCHANLYLNLQEVISEAKDIGVEKIISVGMSVTSQKRIIEITRKYSLLYPALGIHPEEVKMNKNLKIDLDDTIEFIRNHKNEICAIGEIGLDHHFIKDNSLYPLQEQVFDEMLKLAQDFQLPVNLHTKGAEKEIFETLPSYDIPNVNLHWYTGPEEFLIEGLNRGYFFSFNPAINYSPPVKKYIRLVDKEHILLESDGPVKFSGKIGKPSMTKNVLSKISDIKDIPVEELENQIEQNTKEIFPKIF